MPSILSESNQSCMTDLCFGYISLKTLNIGIICEVIMYMYVSITLCKTVATPLLTHWSGCDLAQSHRYIVNVTSHRDTITHRVFLSFRLSFYGSWKYELANDGCLYHSEHGAETFWNTTSICWLQMSWCFTLEVVVMQILKNTWEPCHS